MFPCGYYCPMLIVRWMLDRADTPWYPSMCLFRQKKVGDWQSVMKEIMVALNQK